MKLCWIRYSLQYEQAFFNTEKSNTNREVYLFGVSDDDGIKGIGEIAPLPDWGTESFEQAESLLFKLKNILAPISTLPNQHRLSNLFPTIDFSKHPATSFGLEGAIRIYLYRRYPHSRNVSDFRVPISITIGHHKTEFQISEIEKWYSKGFRTFKLKIDEKPTDELYHKLFDWSGKFNDCHFRLDVQGRWDKDETIHFADKIQSLNIEYLEQPILKSNPTDLKFAVQSSQVPIAIDETLQTLSDADEWIRGSNAILILKPNTFGSISELLDWLKQNNHHTNRIVFSSALDSKLSAFWYAFLAKESGCDVRAAGIATYVWIRNEPIEMQMDIDDGWLTISKDVFNNVRFVPEIENLLFG